MVAKTSTVNAVSFDKENGNFSFPQHIQIRESYRLSSAIISPNFNLVYKHTTNEVLTDDELSVITETQHIAENAMESLPTGIQAVCELLANLPKDSTVDNNTLTSLGWFLRDVCGALERLHTVRDSCIYAINGDALLKSKGVASNG